MIKDNKRYCDRCGVELTKRNNVCGFELCDKCNEVLGQQLAIKNDLADEQHKGDIMEFPKTFDEFANLYGFKDKDEVYTNGSELIPVFRVKQWLEHISTTKNDSKFCPDRKAKTTNMETILHCIENDCVAYKDGKCLKYNSDQEPTTKNDLGVDCIDRKAIEKHIEDGLNSGKYGHDAVNIMTEIHFMPSVTPQLSVPEVTALAEWTTKLTKASEDAYNKGYADGVKSVNICPHCGEYIGEGE